MKPCVGIAEHVFWVFALKDILKKFRPVPKSFQLRQVLVSGQSFDVCNLISFASMCLWVWSSRAPLLSQQFSYQGRDRDFVSVVHYYSLLTRVLSTLQIPRVVFSETLRTHLQFHLVITEQQKLPESWNQKKLLNCFPYYVLTLKLLRERTAT